MSARPLPTSSARPRINLSTGERARVVLLYAVILAATGVGFLVSLILGQTYPILLGFGAVAYTLGLRHGFDADHIAAIDNTTRKLLHERKRTASVGTWFSLGHSSVVAVMVVVLVLSVNFVAGRVDAFRSVGSILGSAIAGAFLWLIGLMNVVIVFEIYRIFRGLREGKLDEAHLEEQLNKRGFMNRYFGRVFKIVREAWQIYPVGVLFGLGFDTFSEIALIGISLIAYGSSGGLPIWMILLLPFLFACGMVLVDTTDSVVMTYAYSWAFSRPIRKVYYNLTVTIISIVVALVIGTVELVSVVVQGLGLTGGVWSALGNLDFTAIGLLIVFIFAGSWILSVAYYRYKGYDDLSVGA